MKLSNLAKITITLAAVHISLVLFLNKIPENLANFLWPITILTLLAIVVLALIMLIGKNLNINPDTLPNYSLLYLLRIVTSISLVAGSAFFLRYLSTAGIFRENATAFFTFSFFIWWFNIPSIAAIGILLADFLTPKLTKR